MSVALSRLDEIAARRGVVVSDIDLSGYMDERYQHDIKPISDYAEQVAELIFCPPEETGVRLAIAPHAKFAFRTHELTVWSGYKGHGKSAFISQAFLQFMRGGQTSFIISPEFHPARLIERMVYQFCGTRSVSEHMLADFFNFAGNRMFLYGNQASLKPDDVVALCRYACDKHKAQHILIDSLMKCGIAPDDYNKQKTFVDRIQNIAHNFGPHIHLVAHARKENDDTRPPRIHGLKGTSEIGDMAENVLIVWRNKVKEQDVVSGKLAKGDEPDAMFIVEAQRNDTGWIGTTPMWFEPEAIRFTGTPMVGF